MSTKPCIVCITSPHASISILIALAKLLWHRCRTCPASSTLRALCLRGCLCTLARNDFPWCFELRLSKHDCRNISSSRNGSLVIGDAQDHQWSLWLCFHPRSAGVDQWKWCKISWLASSDLGSQGQWSLDSCTSFPFLEILWHKPASIIFQHTLYSGTNYSGPSGLTSKGPKCVTLEPMK